MRAFMLVPVAVPCLVALFGGACGVAGGPGASDGSSDRAAGDLDAAVSSDAGSRTDAPESDRAGADGSIDAASTDGARDLATDGACSRKLALGVNIHDGTANPTALASIMAARNLQVARMDLYGNDPAYVTRVRAAVAPLAARQVRVEAIVFDDYSAGGRLSQNCNADLAAVEQAAYNQTISQIRATQGLFLDYEMQNEISLYPNIKKPGTTGQIAADYDVPCAHMQAANLRGMSKAIADVRTSSGTPLRIILGTTDRSFGFLSFMESQGVQFDVVGYHIYPWRQHAPLDQDPWFGPGGPLGQLAKFNRPIHINEFNCGEIYWGSAIYPDEPSYENQAGGPATEACLRGIAKHLQVIASQAVANVESVHFYEALDEPQKAVPENRFGLMYDFDRPKVHLFLAAAFAGGTLSTAERGELTTRGLLTDAQIAAWQPCGAR